MSEQIEIIEDTLFVVEEVENFSVTFQDSAISENTWFEAYVRKNGCVELHRYFNEPKEHNSQDDNDVDFLHICDIDDMISKLQEIKRRSIERFGDNWNK